MKLISSIAAGGIVAMVLLTIIVGPMFTRYEGSSLDNEAFLIDTTPTSFVDRNGDAMVRFYEDMRSPSLYEEIPTEVVDAVIATEDREFFDHAGVNVRAISRAAVRIFQSDGDIVEGGSTITQQLIKNTHLDSSQTLTRKVDEAFFATILEQNMGKEEIFELYVNHIEFPYRAYGIKDAMVTMFGVDFDEFEELDKNERVRKSALLAGMLQAPSYYNPYRNASIDEERYERATSRRDTVLNNMRVVDYISDEEYEEIKEMGLGVLESPKRVFEDERLENQELVHHAMEEASEKLDVSIQEIQNMGVTVHTTFDTGAYEILKEEFGNDSYFPNNLSDGTRIEGAASYINHMTGEIVAFTGGRDEDMEFLGYNRAFMNERQPGSTMKPVVAFGPALESGDFGPDSQFLDDPSHSFGGYSVRNWDGGGRGWVSMREAIRQSWNVPAVWALQQNGMDYSIEYAKDLGLDLTDDNSGLSAALGGTEVGFNVIEMADSYQAFANHGVRTPAHSVSKITDSSGDVLYEKEIETEPVIEPRNAALMKGMLQNAVSSGTGGRASIDGRDIAGKTGTTTSQKDIWFVGFDDNLVGSIWMGTDDHRDIGQGSRVPAEMFANVSPRILDYWDEHGEAREENDVSIEEFEDDVPPKMELIGPASTEINQWEEYDDPGARAHDDFEGDLTDEIEVDTDLNTEEPGDYVITYSVSDSYGNEASIEREIEVIEVEHSVDVVEDLYVDVDDSNQHARVMWNEHDGEEVYFEVYRDEERLETTESASYTDRSLEPGNTYNYYVVVRHVESEQEMGRTNMRLVSVPEQAEIEEPEEVEESEQNEEQQQNNSEDNQNEEAEDENNSSDDTEEDTEEDTEGNEEENEASSENDEE